MQNRSGHADNEIHDARSDSAQTIGEYLRSKRMSRNITLEEVSESTGISTAVLQALEKNDREKLPAEVYIKAFYKKYAEYLGENPEETHATYTQQAKSPKKEKNRPDFNTVITLKGTEESSFVVILRRLFVPIVILVLGVLLFWIYNNYLAPYNPLGFHHDPLPTVCSSLPEHMPDVLS